MEPESHEAPSSFPILPCLVGIRKSTKTRTSSAQSGSWGTTYMLPPAQTMRTSASGIISTTGLVAVFAKAYSWLKPHCTLLLPALYGRSISSLNQAQRR